MFNFIQRAIIYGLLMALALAIFFGVYHYMKSSRQEVVIERQEDQKEVLKAEAKADVFVAESAAIIHTKKEIRDEEIPDTVGIHTIIFDAD